MSRRRRHEPGPERIKKEPARCVCQPGPDAHPEHSKPGRTAADHTNPSCPHWDRSSVVRVVVSNGRRAGKTEAARIKRLQLEPVPEVASDT